MQSGRSPGPSWLDSLAMHAAQQKRIVVAMSGGVDSSTAAAILKTQGHEVIGVGLRLPALLSEEPSERGCCGFRGMDDARRVASLIGIPFYVLDYRDVFNETIVDYFCRCYLEGKTPNPCVECNRAVKFGRLLSLAEALEADCVASGHYARTYLDPDTGRFGLKKGLHADKDQSYFLYPLTQHQLSKVLFPLGELTKDETRAVAKSLGLHVCDKPASQDACFLGDGDYRRFLAQRYPESLAEGPIVDKKGRVLGQHRGIAFYTVGQRKGLGVAAGEPLYVLSVDRTTRTVTVGTSEELETSEVAVSRVSWLACNEQPDSLEAMVKFRYRQEEQPATISCMGGNRVLVRLRTPQSRPAAGQSAVFYNDDIVLGGGIID